MNIWAIANQKGGVGKTTTTVSLAGLLAGRNARVLVIDLDPHGSMTSYFGFDPEAVEQGVYGLFQAASLGQDLLVADMIVQTRLSRLDLMPSSPALATLDRQLGSKAGMGMILAKALEHLTDRYDFVLIDCPPMLGILMISALAACDKLIIPVQTEFLAIKGLERMLHTIDMMGKSLKTRIPYLIVPTLFDRRTKASMQSVQQLRSEHAEHIWGAVIPVDTRFRDASKSGLPISLLDQETRGCRAYEALLKTLTRRELVRSDMVDLAAL